MNYQFETWMLSRNTLIDPETLNFNKFFPLQHSQALMLIASVCAVLSTALKLPTSRWLKKTYIYPFGC